MEPQKAQKRNLSAWLGFEAAVLVLALLFTPYDVQQRIRGYFLQGDLLGVIFGLMALAAVLGGANAIFLIGVMPVGLWIAEHLLGYEVRAPRRE